MPVTNTYSGTCRSCKAWAEKLVGISDDSSLTAADKAKIKEEYGLWEQKTGINAKEGGVGILGIRTRQLMHERRLELLEALRDKPCEPFCAYGYNGGHVVSLMCAQKQDLESLGACPPHS